MPNVEAYRRLVVARAGGACEYCRLLQDASGVTFHIEHVRPRSLADEVLSVISSELLDPFKRAQIEKRVRGAFEYHIRVATDRRRTTQNLRRAMSFLEQRERVEGPLAEFGIPTQTFDFPFSPVPRAASSRQL